MPRCRKFLAILLCFALLSSLSPWRLYSQEAAATFSQMYSDLDALESLMLDTLNNSGAD